jgi:hypothetical protein
MKRDERTKKKILRELFRAQERARSGVRRLEQARAMGFDPSDEAAARVHAELVQDAHNQQIVARRQSDRANKRAAEYIAAHPEEQSS